MENSSPQEIHDSVQVRPLSGIGEEGVGLPFQGSSVHFRHEDPHPPGLLHLSMGEVYGSESYGKDGGVHLRAVGQEPPEELPERGLARLLEEKGEIGGQGGPWFRRGR